MLSRSAVGVWSLRSTGCCALVLPLDELTAAAADTSWIDVARQLARLRRPVSAVDYPPSVFMVGEDELATRPEVT